MLFPQKWRFWRWRPATTAAAAPGTPAIEMVLYQRHDCPLCQEMLRTIQQAGLAQRVELYLVDIDQDPELKARYGLEVPVLEIAGAKAFVGRLRGGDLRQVIAAEERRRRQEEHSCRA